MRLFSQEGYMSVDFASRKLMMIGRERGIPLPGTGGGRLEEITWKEHDSLEAEHAAFAAAVLDGGPVVVDAAAGRRALAAALAVTESMDRSRALAEASGLIRPA
jgi:predicted dehydrogenase